jgi:hypothetical protein
MKLVDTGGKSFAVKVMSFLFGKQAKKHVLGEADFKKNMPTAKAFIVKDEYDFETEKKSLIEAIEVFYEKGIKKELADKHPFFGKMSIEEWDRLHVRHLNHHLSQFGV